ncbi:hypothetical protein [Methanosphaera sp. BMS]|uniref:hypothetical protein n=1 Tax=Methanosphaera sp. BMS TaxID=1789762 RepID=UPI000DC1C279|nr:hypothetical protein [Methanosphaera sp. BMS]AWX32305.1 hypothetical protein AW729_03925 [Methanosphaera sp. BMS]
MNKKILAIIAAIVIIALLIFGYTTYNNLEKTKFASSSVTVPNGYKVANTTDNSIILKNNKTKIVIEETKDSANGLTEKYKAQHENQTVEIKDIKINNTPVKAVYLKNSENKTVKKICYYTNKDKTYIIQFNNYDRPAIYTILRTLG